MHYVWCGVAGALWKQRYCITRTEGFNGAPEESSAILALAVYMDISRAVKDFAEYRIGEEASWVHRSAYHHK